ncbi:Antagonist of MEN (Mitotic Exit Network) [Umbelopsis nana]
MSVLLYSHPSDLDLQTKPAVDIYAKRLPPPKGLFLPELLEQIFEFLALDNSLHACMLVCRDWHTSAARVLWQRVVFDDSQVNHFEKFEEFASVFAMWTPPLHTIRRLLPLCDLGPFQKFQENNDECVQDNADHEVLALQVPKPHEDMHKVSSNIERYRRMLRHLSLRKVKDNTINEPLLAVAKYAQDLTHLDMYICDYLTDTTAMAFITPHLTSISFAGCHQITDTSILLIAKTCHKLVHLDLRACGAVSDASISQIAKSCPRLRHLNVGRIREGQRITYSSVKLIAELTDVAVLGLAGCNLNDDCIQVLARARGNGLERLSVNNCHKLTNRSIRQVLQHCQGLSVFEMKECHLIDDWEAITELVQRKVLMTLCDQQNRACVKWAKSQGKAVKVRAPIK